MRHYSNGNEKIKMIVILCDFIVLNLVLIGISRLLPSYEPTYFKQSPRIIFLVANVSMIFAQYFYHSIIYKRLISVENIISRVLKLAATQAFIMFLFLRIISDGGGFFLFMFIFGATSFLALLLLRLCERFILGRYRKAGGNTRNVVFIGSDPSILTVYEHMIEDPTTGYKVQGYFSKDQIVNCPDGLERLGDLDMLTDLMNGNDADEELKKTIDNADELFCSLSHDASDEIVRIMRFCDNNVIHFYYVPRQFGNYRLNLQPELFGDLSIFTNRREPLANIGNRVLKRTFDIIFSSFACLLLLPFFPIIALIIKIQSPGPVFFKQDRTGMNGHTFKCYKFRSMHVNKDADRAQASKDDPRKFAFGNFMRKTNIDEFPQFINVLKGDMSIVGPRPHMLYHTEVFGNMIDKYMVRHFCRPGITGYAQVTGFRGETKELWQMEERVKRDIWYIENWTFLLDIRIILRTALGIIVPDKNAY
ncbi:MAG: exopolysaccharide biosynthesis polyprenyl glycosylphosphotransferase [Prevotella sp.]|nr:exopolysaccharide biosynthesis polyprenyl glycosylphosphotransferase [Prevotella sp.]